MRIDLVVIKTEDGLYRAHDANSVDYDWNGDRLVALHPEGFGKTERDAIDHFLDELELELLK